MFVVAGSVTADLVIISEEPLAASGADGFRASNLIFTKAPLAVLMGGNGGNAAYVLAGLGLPTALAGMVGRDPLGDVLVERLMARGVNVDALQRSEIHATSTSTIIMTGPTHQTVFHHLGSTAQVDAAHLPEKLLKEAQVLLCASLPLMTKIRAGGFARALEITHRAGGLTALDIGPAIGRPVTLGELRPLLPHTDYLLSNSYELSVLAGEDDWEIAAAHLLAAGARCVVIKRGRDGASVRGSQGTVDVPAFAVEANITVGAGDAFNAGFLYGLKQGWDLAQAVRFGNAVAALVVRSNRGVLGAPALAEVEVFLSRQE